MEAPRTNFSTDHFIRGHIFTMNQDKKGAFYIKTMAFL